MTGEVTITLEDPENASSRFSSFAYSHDGSKLVAASTNKTMLVWSMTTFTVICTPLIGHSDTINSVNWSSDDTKFVSCSNDYTIRIWDATSPNFSLLNTLQGHFRGVLSVAFSQSGFKMVSGGHDNTARSGMLLSCTAHFIYNS